MKIEVNTRKIEPIERVAMALNLKGDEENIALKIQDKINLKDKLIRKLKFENVLLKEKLNKSQNKKEETIIHKDANYQELEKKYNELKNENYELGLALEGLRREIKLYKNEKIANIISNANISKELREMLV